MAYAFVGGHAIASSGGAISLNIPAWTPVATNHLTALLQVTAAATSIVLSDGLNTYSPIGNFIDATYNYLLYEVGSAAGSSITVNGSVSTGQVRGVYVREDSGLANPAYVSGTLAGKLVSAPGTGTGAIASNSISLGLVPCAFVGFCIDESGNSHVMTADTTAGFTGRGAVWSSGLTLMLSEDQRIIGTGGQQILYTAASTGGSDAYFVIGLALAEPGAQLFAGPMPRQTYVMP